LKVPGIWECAILVRKDDDVIAKYDQEVADFLSVTAVSLSLIAKHTGVTPQRKE